MNKLQSLILPLAFLGIAQCLSAQQPLSLDEAVRIALQRSLSLQIQRNEVAAAGLMNNYGVAGGLPTVTATANDQAQVTNIYQKLATGTEIQRNGALGNNLTASVAGTMVLYNGLRISATKDRLAQIEQMNQQELSAQILDLTAAVTTQYYDVRRQQAYLNTLKGSLTVATQNLEIVQARQAAGLANDADLFQAKLDQNSLKQQILSQELAITQAKADLLDLMDEEPGKDVALTDTIAVNSGLNWDELLSGARQHPRIAAATSQIQIQALIERETSSQRLPTLRANAGINFGNNVSNGGFNLVSRNYGPFAGLNLSIPIYNGGALKRQEEVAALTTRNATLQRDLVLQDQETALWKAWQTYQNALDLLESERQNTTLSERLLSLMQQRYALRQATILELKEAQQSYEEAGYRLVNLEFAAKAAEIELRRIAGRLP